MKTGLLERILIGRYGQPITSIDGGLVQEIWNANKPDYSSILCSAAKWPGEFQTRFAHLIQIYGHAFGGFLVGDSLKVAVLFPRTIYGISNIDDLLMQPEVQLAVARDPAIDYFMDEANVLFYGIKAGELWVFDAETDELDSLRPIGPALETLIEEVESAPRDVRG